MEQKPMTEFELCRELNKFGFPQTRRDDGYYFVRPDMLINMKDVDCLYGVDKRPFAPLFDNLIFYPQFEDLLNFVQEDLQQVVQTVSSGFFAYINSKKIPGATIRSTGSTAWLALASAIYAWYLEQQADFLPQVAETSENKVEGQAAPDITSKA